MCHVFYCNAHLKSKKREHKFKCEICGKKFFKNFYLQRHLKVHDVKSKSKIKLKNAVIVLNRIDNGEKILKTVQDVKVEEEIREVKNEPIDIDEGVPCVIGKLSSLIEIKDEIAWWTSENKFIG